MRGLLGFFVVAAIWDAFTTFYGTLAIFHNEYSLGLVDMVTKDINKTIASIGFSLVIVLLLLSAKAVVTTGWHIMFRILVGITFMYDVFTSYMGNQSYIIQSSESTVSQFFILLGLTLVVSGSTVAIPYIAAVKSKDSENSS
jgi:hypothetical protein